jgi:hypothetical protein
MNRRHFLRVTGLTIAATGLERSLSPPENLGVRVA